MTEERTNDGVDGRTATIHRFPLRPDMPAWRRSHRQAFRDLWPEALKALGSPTSTIPFGDALTACRTVARERVAWRGTRRLDQDARERIDDLRDRLDAVIDAGRESLPSHVRLPMASPTTAANPTPYAFCGEDALSLLFSVEATCEEIARLDPEEGGSPFATILVQPDRYYLAASRRRIRVADGVIDGSPAGGSDGSSVPGGSAWVDEVDAFVTTRIVPVCHLARFSVDVAWSAVRRGPELLSLRPWFEDRRADRRRDALLSGGGPMGMA